jgi:hypothetical protein
MKNLECRACKRILPAVNHKGEPEIVYVCPFCGTEGPLWKVTGRGLLIMLVLILTIFIGYTWLR